MQMIAKPLMDQITGMSVSKVDDRRKNELNLTGAFGDIGQGIVHNGVDNEGNDVVTKVNQELMPALGDVGL